MVDSTKQVGWRLFLAFWCSVLFVSTVFGKANDEKKHKKIKTNDFLKFWDSRKATILWYGRNLTNTGTIFKYMGCDQADGYTIEDPEAYSMIPTDEDYSLLVEAYRYAMDRRPQHEQEILPPPVQVYIPNAFQVKVQVLPIPHVGRGIFALQDIKKGTLVSNPTNAMEFYSRDSYRDFVVYANSKNSKIICDSLLWMYAAQCSPNQYCVCLDADATSLINNGVDCYTDDEYDEHEDGCDAKEGDCRWEDMPQTKINIGQYEVVSEGQERTLYGCQEPPIYALRDITAGEELIMSYDDFSEPEGFWNLGLHHVLG